MFTKAIFAAALIALTGGFATQSEARGTCKSVYVQALNQTGKEIKVIDMHYHITGYGKKSEPVKNSDIPSGRAFTYERNLEKADGRETQIELLYRVRKSNKGFDQWTGIKRIRSAAKTCSDRAVYEMKIK